MTSGADARTSAYRDLVAGLLEVRRDTASERFDAEVAAAQHDGRLDERTAKLLRWWQRESVRAITEHACRVIPPTLLALGAAEDSAMEDTDVADSAWARAAGDSLRDQPVGVADTPAVQPAPVTSDADVEVPPPADLAERRGRRMLLAGLTRVTVDG